MKSLPKAIFKFDNVWCEIICGPNLLSYIDEKLSFVVPGHQFSRQFKKRRWDGKKRFLKKNTKLFQTGLLPYVLSLLPETKINITLIDLRRIPPSIKQIGNKLSSPSMTVDKWTRTLDYVHFRSNIRKNEYQVETMNTAIHNSLKGIHWPRGVLKLSPGAGKTLIAAGIAKLLGLKFLLTVHRLDLVTQIKEVFEQIFDIPIGQIGGGKCELNCQITISSVQTLYSRVTSPRVNKFIKSIQVWVVDESHFVSDNSYFVISNHFISAYYRFGLSGSAFEKSDIDNMFARSVLGNQLVDISSSKLIKDNLLVRPIIHILEYSTLPEISGDLQLIKKLKKKVLYHEHSSEFIVLNESRNMLISQITQKEESQGAKVLILVSRIPHGHLLYSLISPFCRCVYIHGDSTEVERSDAVKMFSESQCNVLIASTIFDLGRDIPIISSVIMAGGGKSSHLTVQRVGRGIRTSPGLDFINVWDFYDRIPPFDVHTERRISAYKAQGWEVIFSDVI